MFLPFFLLPSFPVSHFHLISPLLNCTFFFLFHHLLFPCFAFLSSFPLISLVPPSFLPFLTYFLFSYHNLTYQNTMLQETEKSCRVLNGLTKRHVRFWWIYKEKQFFCGHNFLTEVVFVAQVYSNAVISSGGTV